MHDAQYLQVATYGRLDEAEVARGLLESEGIPVALLDSQTAALGLGPAVGGVRVLVPADEAGRAAELLANPPRDALDEIGRTPTPIPMALKGVAPPAPPPLATRLAMGTIILLAGAAAVLMLR
jgi:hypothetical protein